MHKKVGDVIKLCCLMEFQGCQATLMCTLMPSIWEQNTGVTGLLLAALALRQNATSPMKQLRNMNVYVGATLNDWHNKQRLIAHSPLGPSPCPLHGIDVVAGTASFGMSGVNANCLVQQPPNLSFVRLEAFLVTPRHNPMMGSILKSINLCSMSHS